MLPSLKKPILMDIQEYFTLFVCYIHSSSQDQLPRSIFQTLKRNTSIERLFSAFFSSKREKNMNFLAGIVLSVSCRVINGLSIEFCHA